MSTTNARIYKGVINAIDMHKMSADVFVHDTGSLMKNVLISQPMIGKLNTMSAMPSVGDVCFVCIPSTRYGPFIFSYPPNNNGLYPFTPLMEDEILLEGPHKSSLRFGFNGDINTKSNLLSGTSSTSKGTIEQISLGSLSKTLSSKSISGIGVDRLDSTLSNKENEINTVNQFDFYQKVALPNVYSEKDISSDESIQDVILSDATSLINLIEKNQDTDSLNSTIQNTADGKSDIHSAIEKLNDYLNDFILKPHGVKVNIQIGSVLNKQVDSPCDIMGLTNEDINLSRWGVPNCLSVKVTDIETGKIVSDVSVDSEGNCHMKFKRVFIETESYEVKEGIS